VPNKREKRRLIRYGGNDDDDHDDEVANKCVFVETDRNMSIYICHAVRYIALHPTYQCVTSEGRRRK
jgi:hypothetical protein